MTIKYLNPFSEIIKHYAFICASWCVQHGLFWVLTTCLRPQMKVKESMCFWEIYRDKLMKIFCAVHSWFFWSPIVDEFQDEILVEVIKHIKIKNNKFCLKTPERTFIMLFLLSNHHIQNPKAIIWTNHLHLIKQWLSINLSRPTGLK